MPPGSPLTLATLCGYISGVNYRDWTPCVQALPANSGFLFWWEFKERDNTNPSDPTLHTQKCREWYIAPTATRTNVINTAYLAARVGMEHEFMEQFTLNGAILRDPHTPIP